MYFNLQKYVINLSTNQRNIARLLIRRAPQFLCKSAKDALKKRPSTEYHRVARQLER